VKLLNATLIFHFFQNTVFTVISHSNTSRIRQPEAVNSNLPVVGTVGPFLRVHVAENSYVPFPTHPRQSPPRPPIRRLHRDVMFPVISSLTRVLISRTLATAGSSFVAFLACGNEIVRRTKRGPRGPIARSCTAGKKIDSDLSSRLT
jgi:hypothetical protein